MVYSLLLLCLRIRLPAAGVSILGLLALAGCQTGEPHKEDERPPVAVRVAAAERRTLQPSFSVVGTVLADPERMALLAPNTAGLVERLAVPEGSRVAKGDLVVQLDERPAKVAFDRAEAGYVRLIARPRPEELAQARALVARVRAAHATAEARLKKTQELRARSPELVPEVQLLDDQKNERIARSDLETAEAQLALLEQGPREEQRREAHVEVEAARLNLELCKITAPFAGEVVELRARVGQKADVGTPVAVILDTSEVFVQARVPANRLAGLQTVLASGSARDIARVHCLAFPGQVFQARAGWLNQQTEGVTSDVPVKLRVSNPKGLLRVGMTVRVELQEPPVEGVAIPEIAVTVNEEGHRVVTVVRDGKAVPTEIELAAEGGQEVRDGGWVLVATGLHPGDAVAVENGYALPEGTLVTILPPQTAARNP